MKFLYSVLFFIFSLFYLPTFFMKGKHKGGFSERLGIVPESVVKGLQGKKVIWLHGVSVGEIVQAMRFREGLSARAPDAVFVLTTITAAGRSVAEKSKRPEDALLYFPVDFRFAVRQFLDRIGPSIVVILETEIWPNLIWELSRRQIPVSIVNARISDRAMVKYRVGQFFIRHVLKCVERVGAQDETARGRFVELGVPTERVFVTGHMKYDWEPSADHATRLERLKGWDRNGASRQTLWIAGSTHEGEEEIIFRVYQNVSRQIPGLRLLVAPRHLERLDDVEKKARVLGLAVFRFREIPNAEAGVILLDEMGLLASFYAAADFVFVGGSLVNVGGHNLVEPAYFKKPVLFGPHMQNFKEMAADFKNRGAGIEVKNAEDLERQVLRLATETSVRQTLGESAARLVRESTGASARNLEILFS